MTLPTFHAMGGEAAGTGDVVPGRPTGWAVNDIWLMSVEQSAVNVYGSPPTSWALVTGCQQKPGTGATDPAFQVYWHRADAGDTSDPTVTDTINHTSAVIAGFRGCVTSGDPWDVSNGGIDAVSTTAAVVTGNTTTVADCLIAIFIASGEDTLTDQFSLYTNLDLANITERYDFMTDQGNGGGVGMATGEKASAGAYGNTAVTLANASTKAFCTIALKPATGRTTKNTDPRPIGQFSGISRTMINPNFQMHESKRFFIPSNMGKVVA